MTANTIQFLDVMFGADAELGLCGDSGTLLVSAGQILTWVVNEKLTDNTQKKKIPPDITTTDEETPDTKPPVGVDIQEHIESDKRLGAVGDQDEPHAAVHCTWPRS